MIPDKYKPLVRILKWSSLILYILIILYDGEPQATDMNHIPPPDPSKGMALGYDFNEKEYRYYDLSQDDYFNGKKGSTNIQIIPTSNGCYEFDEDDARDLLDYYID